MKRQTDGEKPDQLGTLGPEGQHGGEFPEFPFCLIYSRFEAEEAKNPGCPWAQTKASAKAYLLKPKESVTLARKKIFRH